MRTATKYSQPHQNTQETSRRQRQYPLGRDVPPSKSLRRVRSGRLFARTMAHGIALENERLAAMLAVA